MRGQYGHAHSNSQSIGQKAQLSNAYQELGKALTSRDITTIGNYSIGNRVLGEGSFGTVYMGIHRLTKVRVAIKQIAKSLPLSSGFNPVSSGLQASTPLQLLTREIHHHRRLHHPNVLQLYEIIATESSIYLIFELCAGGELFDYLLERGRFTPMECRRIFGQLCLGVSYIHSMGVVHRDLKLENVLLDGMLNVKIADFGFGREFEGRRMLETFCGTTGYAAPEMLAGKKYAPEEVDIWSLGIIFYTLLTGSMPFDDDDEGLLKAKIIKGDYYLPEWLGEDCCDLISNILQVEPSKRLSIKQILAHPWFSTPLPNYHLDPHNEYDGVPPAIPEAEETVTVSSMHDHDHDMAEVTVIPPTPILGDSQTSQDEASSRSSSEALSVFGEENGKGKSGSSSPITSDDDSQPTIASVIRVPSANGKKDKEEGKLGFHRNESQSTIRRTGDDVDSRGSSPRSAGGGLGVGGISRPPSLPTHMESPAASPGEEDEINLFSTAKSVASASSSRPPLPTTFGSSSSNFTGSTATPGIRPPSSTSFIANLPPPAVHSRTPSRTKRRSVGSVISDRGAIFHEDHTPHVDYLSLLNQPTPPRFETDLEKRTLESLELLGFDVGQIQHSVKHDACDAAGALWWILKKKAEDKEEGLMEVTLEAEPAEIVEEEEAEVLRPSVEIAAKASTSRLQLDHLDEAESESEGLHKDKGKKKTFGWNREKTASKDDLKRKKSSGSLISEVMSIASSPSGVISSLSAPALAFFGFPRDSSPSKEVLDSPSNESLPARPRTGSPSFTSLDRPPAKTPEVVSPPRVEELKLKKSNFTKPRSASVGVFQRATNVFTLSSKKSEELKEKNRDREGSDDRSVVSTPVDEGGRSTPNLASFFTRKHSAVSTVDIPKSPPPTPSAIPSQKSMKESMKEEEKNPAAIPLPADKSESGHSDPSTSKKLQTLKSKESLGADARDEKPPESPTMSTGAASQRTARKPKGSNFFSSFKLWFNDDRRKRGKRPSTSSGLTYAGDSLSRRPSRRNDGTLRARRPGGSTGASRRSSQASLHPAIIAELKHTRRLSESSRVSGGSRNGNRTPTSEKGRSRPPSAQSHARRKAHARAGSQGSASSIRHLHAHGKASPVPSYRRPPTSTTIRRVSQATFTNKKHGRKESASSSIHTSSRPSSLRERRNSQSDSEFESMTEENDNPTIHEENESISDSIEEAREKAFRKLSGEFVMQATTASMDTWARSTGSRHGSFVSRSGGSHLFGPPSSAGIGSTRSSASTIRPQLRNVFAKGMKEDGEWVDEDEDLDCYGGGLGQPSSKSSASSATSSNDGHTFAAQQQRSYMDGSLSSFDSTVSGGSSILGEGRYAGVGTSGKGEAQWRPGTLRNNQPSFRGPVIEEEEEEE
ncbi:Pkinase-domain-containing protein [Atractiella rhizophila]|nr:Pkinase-domain-containing protein [Atractiella rhizophila]